MLFFSSVTLVISECSCDNLKMDSITLKSFFFFYFNFQTSLLGELERHVPNITENRGDVG